MPTSPIIAAVEASEATVVTPQQRERWDRDGFLIIEDTGIDEATVDGAVADTEDLYEKEEFSERWGTPEGGDHGVFYTSHRVMDAWKISDNVKRIALAP